MEQNYEEQFDILIDAAIKIGNSLNNDEDFITEESLVYAEGLGQKVLHHVLSARKLYDGDQLDLKGNLYAQQVDFASIAILTRAALETYLAFNFLFISPQNQEQRKFRFACWYLALFLEMKDAEAKSELHAKIIESNKLEIERVTMEIQATPSFGNYTPKQQKQILEGNWKLFKTWKDLAVSSGFNAIFFKQQYSYLCGYAHSGGLSVLMIKHTRHFQTQKKTAEGFMSILMIVLAKFMIDYIQVMPKLVDEKFESEYSIMANILNLAGEALR